MTTRQAKNRRPVKTPVGDPEEDRTIQSAADETDINVLLKRFQRGAPMPTPDVGVYLDVSEVPRTLLGMHEATQRAEDAFAALPSAVRKVAGNSWQGLVRALQSEDGPQALQDAGFDLGLEPTPQEPVRPVVAAPGAPQEAPPASPETSPAAQPDAQTS